MMQISACRDLEVTSGVMGVSERDGKSDQEEKSTRGKQRIKNQTSGHLGAAFLCFFLGPADASCLDQRCEVSEW